MTALETLGATQPVAAALLVVSLVAAAGIALGSLKVRGIGLGSAGVLFAGLLAGHLGYHVEPMIRQFLQEFGLVLFVYTIGLQLGPGFFTSLRRQGLSLNLLAFAVVALGVLLTLGLASWLGIDMAAAIGLFAGATTNTPALGAAQDTLRATGANADAIALSGVGYSIAYPGGIVGIISSILLLRFLLRINPEQEARAFRENQRSDSQPLERLNVEVTNPNLDGLPLGRFPGAAMLGLVVSRHRRRLLPEAELATSATIVHVGDTLLVVGPRPALESFQLIVGKPSADDLMQAPGHNSYRRVVVTSKAVLGRKVGDLNLEQTHGVVITRVTRGDLEITAVPGVELQFGDMVQLVGTKEHLDQAARQLGNSLQALNHTNFVPVFIGLALGVVAGMFPVNFPGLPVPVRLGLAGGPLLVALLLSRVGRIGRLVWYMPVNANLAFRELGIVLFLACVGLKSGERFFETLLSPTGLKWAFAGLVITVVPLLVVGWFGRRVLKQNYMTTCGLLAGSMTDPPALAFANATAGSDAPSVAYATVYPLTMILRIVAAQLLAILFAG